MSFATTWMNLEDIGDYTKWNKPDRERNSPWYHLYVELENINLKVEFILIIVGNTIQLKFPKRVKLKYSNPKKVNTGGDRCVN